MSEINKKHVFTCASMFYVTKQALLDSDPNLIKDLGEQVVDTIVFNAVINNINGEVAHA